LTHFFRRQSKTRPVKTTIVGDHPNSRTDHATRASKWDLYGHSVYRIGIVQHFWFSGLFDIIIIWTGNDLNDRGLNGRHMTVGGVPAVEGIPHRV
jgi:hypothetical protein